ncbi:MAG: NADH-quinone oxidoreductase subunit C/D [Syntrophus sp. SKADARSKE-3]|nr:NADH-quinone oxidoreductase subunit C/D [Syntrophus sp. SKADARSKE-3]
MNDNLDIQQDLKRRFSEIEVIPQATKDGIPTFWVQRRYVADVLRHLKSDIPCPYRMLNDLTAIDERERQNRQDQPGGDFTVVYHLLSYGRNTDIRIKTSLLDEDLSIPTIVDLWPSANWYEREVWDMFGIRFDGHPNLRRILMPPTWHGHPLRKEHPARGTEMDPFDLPDWKAVEEEKALQFHPEDWGMTGRPLGRDYLFLNLGPQHPGTHGLLRIVLQLDGEEIRDALPDIGYHHRGAEKMGERQSWHTFIPYTDRIDYLSGVMNNFPYVLAVETLAGIEVPGRAKIIRIIMAELFRIISHLVWYGTFALDMGAMSPVFYTFNDRERAFEIVEAICGGRMHPMWFRIGGVAQDLPRGWDRLIRDFLDYLPKRLDEYDGIIMKNRIFKARTKGVGVLTRKEAIDWGVTGPNLRACGYEWDFRKKRPYSGYDALEFDIPTATDGDCFSRAVVRIEEMRQSLRIIRQRLSQMPAGPYKSDHPLVTPPRKEQTFQDIETLINHFLSVSWGPVIPPGEASVGIESAKGLTAYYLISDGGTMSYRTRIRTPSFAHIQAVPMLCRGLMIPDLIAILGSIDFVLADVDR